MGINEKHSNYTKILVIFLFVILFLGCNNTSKQFKCNEVNEKSMLLFYDYYIYNNSAYLDSALLLVDYGLNYCNENLKILSLRKLSILAEQQNYLDAVTFIDSFDKKMFSELSYYQEVLRNKFIVMNAIKEKDLNKKNEYLKLSVSLIENYLLEHKDKIDSLMKQSNIQSILKSSLSTAITQYYYYKSHIDLSNAENDLNNLKEESGVNVEFIDYLNEFLKADLMEFVGI